METVVSTAVDPAAEEQKSAELQAYSPHSRPHVELMSNGAGSEAFNKNPTSPSQ